MLTLDKICLLYTSGKSQSLTSLPYYQGSTMHALYQANEVLGSRIDQLYACLLYTSSASFFLPARIYMLSSLK